MRNEDWVLTELANLKEHDQIRTLRSRTGSGGKFTDRNGKTILNFSSNDYLDLSSHPDIVKASRRYLEQFGCGSGASRLMSGNLAVHEQLDQDIASYKGYPAALTFGSGFLANAGIIPALAGRTDCIFTDKLVHASILAGIRLSGARLLRFEHNNAGHLEKLIKGKSNRSGRKLVITESVFSMDGDIAPLTDIATVCEQNSAMLMVDEAHATGIFGAGGNGLINDFRLRGKVNIAMGTFSKALGNYGGFCACSAPMRSWLVTRARSLIYTTSLPPAVAGGCRKALEVLRRQPELGNELLERAKIFREELEKAGLDTGKSESQIIPVIIGDSKATLSLSKRLYEHGILATAVRPPTVPRGSARLRLSLTLAHTPEDLQRAVRTIADAVSAET